MSYVGHLFISVISFIFCKKLSPNKCSPEKPLDELASCWKLLASVDLIAFLRCWNMERLANGRTAIESVRFLISCNTSIIALGYQGFHLTKFVDDFHCRNCTFKELALDGLQRSISKPSLM